MTFVLLVSSTIIFIESFLFLDLSIQVRRILSETRLSCRVLGSNTYTDAQKEAHLRNSSRQVGGATGVLFLKLIGITAIVALPYTLLALIRPYAVQQLLADLSSPLVLAALTVVGCAYVWIRHAIFRPL
jgi:hypothetical protein